MTTCYSEGTPDAAQHIVRTEQSHNTEAQQHPHSPHYISYIALEQVPLHCWEGNPPLHCWEGNPVNDKDIHEHS